MTLLHTKCQKPPYFGGTVFVTIMASLVAAFLAILIGVVQISISREVQYNQMLKTLNGIVGSIKSTFPFCSSLNYLFESSANVLQDTLLEMLTRADRLESDVENPAANLFIDLGLEANNLVLPKMFFFENNFHFRYYKPCTVILFQVTSSFLDNAVNLNNATFGHRWPERILPLLPSTVQSSFFLFFIPEVESDISSLDVRMNELMDQTGMILHSVFIIPVSSSKISVLKGLPKNSQGGLEPVASCESGRFKILQQKELFHRMYVDFKGAKLKGTYCPICAPDEEEYKQTGMGQSSHDDTLREILKLFNMTLEIQIVFAVPDIGVKANGKLDEFVLPLVNGTAAVTGLVVHSHLVDHLIYLTKPYVYDTMLFLTGPPKLHNPDPFDALREPLEARVWIAGIIASLSVCGCMSTAVVFLKIKGGGLRGVLASVYRPVLDQAGLFAQRARSGTSNLLLGTWLLGLIVLGNSYKSKLIAAILIPRYDYPPRTFSELAKSNYEIGAIFFATVSNQFATFNTSVNTQLLRRIKAYNFMKPDCYQMIFEDKKACIGYTTILARTGLLFTVNTKGRMMALRSIDTHFHGTCGTGLSKFYPMILEPFDYYTSLFDQSGISEYLNYVRLQKYIAGGKNYAKKNMKTKKYYEDVKDSLSNDEKVQAVIIQVLTRGLSSAFVVFILEHLSKIVLKLIWACNESRILPWNDQHDCSEWDPVTTLAVHSASTIYIYFGELLSSGERIKAVS